MKPLKLLLSIIALLLMSQNFQRLLAQETPNKLSLEKGSIANRFDYVIKESTTFQDSRVVKSWWLTRLKSHVSDSLNGLHKELLAEQKMNITKDAQIDSLKQALINVNNTLTISRNEKNSMYFFGIAMSKQAYNGIVWAIILVLSMLLIIFILLFKRSNVVTKQTKLSLADLKEEFDSHRKRALEREEALVNKFHSEVNKLKSKKP